MDFLFSGEGIVALLTLTILEIVLGIDNIIFISVLVSRLPKTQQAQARFIGLTLALVLRLVFLAGATFIAGLTEPLIELGPIPLWGVVQKISGRDLIMLGGGLFLLGKATSELYIKVEMPERSHAPAPSKKAGNAFAWMIAQIIVLDIVFSIDSVITAIGLTTNYPVMATAVVVSVIVMLVTSSRISTFIEAYPSVKILALAFLLMVGMVLVAEGLEMHIPKGYVYFAMAFSMAVEALNIRFRKKRDLASEGGNSST